ncbi:callose synthase 4-like [Lactuca sativa]|uniref:callose synthase 4-like n=1 Tax=Lactuca sativa TaxID=4236 RepID=UPI000CD81664|nr:callose synthase 4-like [Lactuca sativa]
MHVSSYEFFPDITYNIGIVISIWDPIVMLLVREDALAEFKTNLLQQNLKIIQSLLLLQLPGVQEKLKKQIKEVELAQSKEVSLHWPGMAESVKVIGGIYVAFSHLGEIRTLGMLHSRFKWVTSAFCEHLVPMQKEEPKRYHGDYHTRCYE